MTQPRSKKPTEPCHAAVGSHRREVDRGKALSGGAAAAEIPDHGFAAKSLSIVIVDDSEDNAEMLAEFLESYGHRVRVANLGRRLLDLIEADLPDVVLVDIGLPDMNGYEVAESVRARCGDEVYLIALTGFSGTEVRNRAHGAGFNSFITKPFRHEDLLDELRGAA